MVDVNDFLSNIKMFKVNYDDKEFIENFEKQTNIKITKNLSYDAALAILYLSKSDGIYYDVEEEIDISQRKIYNFPKYMDIIKNILCDVPIYLDTSCKFIKMNSLSYVNLAYMDRSANFILCTDDKLYNIDDKLSNKVKLKYTCYLLNIDNLNKLLSQVLILYPFFYNNNNIKVIV
jgi:hypothetical protein